MKNVTALKGDITQIACDAIVNAANTSLLGGGGVDGAIHRAAGPGLLEECRRIGGCKTGDAKLTAGYDLPAQYVIHTVGPVWQGGGSNEEALLRQCYQRSLALGDEVGAKSIAFPAISTGVYMFPSDLAADIAVATVCGHPAIHEGIMEAMLVAFDEKTLALYQNRLA